MRRLRQQGPFEMRAAHRMMADYCHRQVTEGAKTYKLLIKRKLVQLELVYLGGGTAHQHGGREQGAGGLHGERWRRREQNNDEGAMLCERLCWDIWMGMWCG